MLAPKDLPLLAVFATVARSGSFTVAARELGISKSVVSGHVRTLEEKCRVRLLERTTRRLRPTQAGEAVLAAAGAVVDAVREVDRILEEHHAMPVGTLRVATTHDLGSRFVAPVAAKIASRHAQLQVEIIADDLPHDLVAERLDVAVRLGPPADSSHVMRRLGTEPEVVATTPALAARFAHVSRPGELADAPWVGHSRITLPSAWIFRNERGEQDELTVKPRSHANTSDGMRALLVGGAGFGVMPRYILAEDFRAGRLVHVCPGWSRRVVTLYAMLPTKKHTPVRVELFIAALREALVLAGIGGDAPERLGKAAT